MADDFSDERTVEVRKQAQEVIDRVIPQLNTKRPDIKWSYDWSGAWWFEFVAIKVVGGKKYEESMKVAIHTLAQGKEPELTMQNYAAFMANVIAERINSDADQDCSKRAA